MKNHLIIPLLLALFVGFAYGQKPLTPPFQPAPLQPVNPKKPAPQKPVTPPKGQWVDLGLPSGTLWKNTNENGLYSHSKAANTFGNSLPSRAQWNELLDKCSWNWDKKNLCFKIVGPNGNSISLPAAGYTNCQGEKKCNKKCGNYWASTAGATNYAYSLYFNDGKIGINETDLCFGFSIRLTKNTKLSFSKDSMPYVPYGYVDLGLPSGTKWKLISESDMYSYSDAVKKFGNTLPSKKQWEELIEHCRWVWHDYGEYIEQEGERYKIYGDSWYEVIGKNGKSIVIKASGFANIKEDLCVGCGGIGGVAGYYLSSTMAKNTLWHLYFESAYTECSGWEDFSNWDVKMSVHLAY